MGSLTERVKGEEGAKSRRMDKELCTSAIGKREEGDGRGLELGTVKGKRESEGVNPITVDRIPVPTCYSPSLAL